MTHFLEIGGSTRPVRFGFSGLYEYERRTGRNAVADFQSLSVGGGSVSVTLMVDLVLCGLQAGYRSEHRNIDFSEYDVADWLGDDIGIIERVMACFVESFPQGEGTGKAAPAKRGRTPAPGKRTGIS